MPDVKEPTAEPRSIEDAGEVVASTAESVGVVIGTIAVRSPVMLAPGADTSLVGETAERAPKLPAHAIELRDSSLHEILSSTNKVRHTAVHRLPTTTRGIDQLIQYAMKLAIALRGPLRVARLGELHSDIGSKIRALELIKNTMEDDISRKLQETHQQISNSDREEKEYLAKMLDEHLKNKSLLELFFEESARKILDESAILRADFPTDCDELEAKSREEDANGFVEAV